MGELKFIGKRVVYLAVMLFGVATLVFILTKMIPGDPVVANLSQRALNDPEIVAAYRAKHGLDRPLIVQYIYYIRDLLHFDLGTLSVPAVRYWTIWQDVIPPLWNWPCFPS